MSTSQSEKSAWGWYGCTCDETFSEGPFSSREECIKECTQQGLGDYDGGFHIVEARKDDIKLSAYFDSDLLIENAEDRAYDDHGGEDPLFEVTAEQAKDLEFVVRMCIDRWQVRHGLTFEPWCLTASRNEDYIQTNGEEND
jgi:hypothetical protein